MFKTLHQSFVAGTAVRSLATPFHNLQIFSSTLLLQICLKVILAHGPILLHSRPPLPFASDPVYSMFSLTDIELHRGGGQIEAVGFQRGTHRQKTTTIKETTETSEEKTLPLVAAHYFFIPRRNGCERRGRRC